MNYIFLDIEVYPEWFCIVTKARGSGVYRVYDSDTLSGLDHLSEIFANPNNVIVGYNIKGYDLPVIGVMYDNWNKRLPAQVITNKVFETSETIVGGGEVRFQYNMCTFSDLADDLNEYLSLKEYESNKGLSITECPVSFGKRNLSPFEKEQIIEYCKRDVDASEVMFDDRETYIKTKLKLADMFNLNPYFALKRTDPSLCSDILVKNKNFDKSFLQKPVTYELPDRIRDYILKSLPRWVVDKFLDYRRFRDVEKTFELFENVVTIGEGGLHSVHKLNVTHKDNVLFIDDDPKYVNVIADGTSYYPHIIWRFDYQSRAITDKSLYPSILQTRLALKAEVKKNPDIIKEKPTIEEDMEAIKLILNGTGGAEKQEFLSLFDPEMNVRLCFTGQLLLLALCQRLYTECGVKVVQTNTDGIMIRIPVEQRRPVYALMLEWQAVSQIPLDITVFDRMWQANVNNYVMTLKNGKIKNKGEWLKNKINPFKNICFPIINKAIMNYLVSGTSLVDTIYNEKDARMFLYTTKRGRTFNKTVFKNSAVTVTVGRVNRVYASTSKDAGMLYKVKGTALHAMPNCPKKCRLYNEVVVDVPSDLDYGWYLSQATDELNRLRRVDLK